MTLRQSLEDHISCWRVESKQTSLIHRNCPINTWWTASQS